MNNMSSRATPAIVLEPTGNLQGTYKFFSLETGKKIKRRRMTPYPMPDSVIKKVERFARQGAVPGVFDFADRSGILFEWNESIEECPEGLVKEDMVLYPSLVAEFPGVTLDRDIGVTAVDNDIEPHGHPEDAATHNAGLEPLGIAGVDRAAIVDALEDEIAHQEPDDENSIIAVADLPPAAWTPADTLYVNDDIDVPGADQYNTSDEENGAIEDDNNEQ